MDVKGVHHVAVAVEDLEAAIETYRTLFGAQLELLETIAAQGVEAAYLRIGASRIELLAALGGDTPVGRFLAKRGPGIHHVAVEVDDVEQAVRALAAAGATVIDPEPRPGVGGHRVSFVHPESVHGVLVEVVSHG